MVRVWRPIGQRVSVVHRYSWRIAKRAAAPKTYGDLRKLLAEVGDPWEPDPTRSDDELLPEYPTGGDDYVDPPERRLDEAGIDKLLRSTTPPLNPDIRAAWREAGLLSETDDDKAPPRVSRKRKPTEIPAPDSGG